MLDVSVDFSCVVVLGSCVEDSDVVDDSEVDDCADVLSVVDFSCVVEVVVSADSGADCDEVSFVVDDVSVEDAF